MWRAGSICFPSSVWVWHQSAYLWAVWAGWKFPPYRCGPQCLICWWMGNHGRSFLSFPHPLQSCYYNMYNIYLLIIMNTHTLFTIYQLGSWVFCFCYFPFLPLISHYLSERHVKNRKHRLPPFSVGLTPVGLLVGRSGPGGGSSLPDAAPNVLSVGKWISMGDSFSHSYTHFEAVF